MKCLGAVRAIAKELTFPLPLLAISHQQLIRGKLRDPASAALVEVCSLQGLPSQIVWENYFGVSIRDAADKELYSPSHLAEKFSAASATVGELVSLALGNGFWNGNSFTKIKLFCDCSFFAHFMQVYEPSLTRFADVGGLIGHSPAEVSRDVDVLIIMVANDIQAESILFGDGGSVSDEHKNLKLVDAPVSGGVKRAADGTLTIMASATDEALEHSSSVLSGRINSMQVQSFHAIIVLCFEKLYVIRGGCGAARMLFDIITKSQGNSWMFGNRVPHMLDNDYTPYSAVDIFVKDLGIVNNEGSVLSLPLNLSAVAHQQFLAGSASGWGRLDDAAVVKVYEKLTGVTVEGKHAILKKEKVLNSLPPEWPEDPIVEIKKLEGHNTSKVLVVLDDDPTGTQTVHDIEVLTEWSVDSLVQQFLKRPSCFFILTNSRSLSSEKAYGLTEEICRNIDTAAKSVGDVDFSVVLRGGRYTINNIHYVADSDSLVPAGDTEFSKDAAFGYKASNLCEWVEEKTRGQISASSVASISIQLLRKGGPSAVCEHLCSLPKGSVCIVNAASDRDVAVFAAGMIQASQITTLLLSLAEMKGKCFLCRTAASFVSARIGIKPKAPISPDNLSGKLLKTGILGLKSKLGHVIKCIEVSVDKLSMSSSEVREEEIRHAAESASSYLRLGKDTLLMTSRELIKGKTPSESLEINFKVSSALVEIVRRINVRPRYIIAKGGITSSDLATKALEAHRAQVVGQALPGVPFWELGPESRYPGIPYIVFPGNVGDDNSLAEVVQKWSHPPLKSSTKELLVNAEKSGYAVGAFNVYNLEGVEAVIAAAEAEKSPAILQVHPGALKLGGHPLVACCIYAAERASVPIAVQFDHGSSQQELLEALELGFNSIMVDGSHLPFEENISFTKHISSLAHASNIMVEAELGRLSGTEDDLTVEDYEARLTDMTQAEKFIDETGIDALAVCIGNVHGKYPASGPNLRLDLLKDLHELASKKGIALVLHGASGLPEELIKECAGAGVRKFNVNTEVRNAYLESLRKPSKDLVHVMSSAKDAMKAVVVEKMRLFGSSGRA
ncbi:unnamed protein product [Spirodela intermedia]|uniref:Uncharacterized protein n=1 Tax=Spirodela intermedia TaxID=51605 RepID=A0A7I8J434_SPIIN|nr:unnamed protein product [Spirodela intermedia]CAA6664821.1 unnamed protein product [Spirodela intermedia]